MTGLLCRIASAAARPSIGSLQKFRDFASAIEPGLRGPCGPHLANGVVGGEQGW
jgi:hypothetical protein